MTSIKQWDTGQKMPDGANYNAVIKGIPINTQIFPVPYYMPDDFVLIQFDYACSRSKHSTVGYNRS